MKKKLIIVISILALLVFIKFNYKNFGDMSSSDEIQLWFYDSDDCSIGYSKEIVRKVKNFCDSKNIPLKVYEYSMAEMTYDDYSLKRNISAATGNMITIDDARRLRELSKHHADYTKLNGYNNLLSVHKGRYCIPLGINYSLRSIENETMKYFDIKKPENLILTYNEYLEIKQEIKEKGAKIKLNSLEYLELIDYHLNENGLLFVDEESKNIKNSNKFKEMLKKSIIEVCNDIILNYDSKLYGYNIEGYDNNRYIYDEKSGLIFSDLSNASTRITKPVIANPYSPFGIKDILKKTLFVNPSSFHSPSLYMHKKISNNKIYDVANYILSESCYFFLYEDASMFVPTFDTANIRRTFQVNNEWKYIGNVVGDMGEVKKEIKTILDEVYKIFINDQLKEVYDEYYLNTCPVFNNNYSTSNIISNFVKDVISDIAKTLSGDNLVLSIESFDPEQLVLKKMIDDKVNQFVDNFYVHNY